MDTNQHAELSLNELLEITEIDFGDVAQPNEEVVVELPTEEQPTQTVEETVEEQAPQEEEEIEANTQTNSIHTILAKEKLASGEWEDVIVTIDGEEKKLSELDFIDEETYQAVLEDDKKHKEETFNSKYVDVENLNETQKSLINIIKSGDLEKAKELFENPEQLKEPFQGYDSTNDAHNEQIVRWYYKQQGNSEKEIDALVNVAKEELSLDTRAEKIVEHGRTQFKETLKNKEQELQEIKKKEEENRKVYRKELLNTLKEDKVASETLLKKFIDVATKPNKDGELEIDNIYEEKMKDPKQASRLIHFLLDEQDFLKKESSKVKTETHKGMLRQVGILRDTTKTASQKTEVKEENRYLEID